MTILLIELKVQISNDDVDVKFDEKRLIEIFFATSFENTLRKIINSLFVWYQLINIYIRFDFLLSLSMHSLNDTRVSEHCKLSRTLSSILWFKTFVLVETVSSKCWKELIFCVIRSKNDLLTRSFSSFSVSSWRLANENRLKQ